MHPESEPGHLIEGAFQWSLWKVRNISSNIIFRGTDVKSSPESNSDCGGSVIHGGNLCPATFDDLRTTICSRLDSVRLDCGALSTACAFALGGTGKSGTLPGNLVGQPLDLYLW